MHEMPMKRPEKFSPVVLLHIWVDWCQKRELKTKMRYNIFKQQRCCKNEESRRYTDIDRHA